MEVDAKVTLNGVVRSSWSPAFINTNTTKGSIASELFVRWLRPAGERRKVREGLDTVIVRVPQWEGRSYHMMSHRAIAQSKIPAVKSFPMMGLHCDSDVYTPMDWRRY